MFLGYTPLPPGLVESRFYARESIKIFGFKELIDKIFRTKDLASGESVPRRYARRDSFGDLSELRQEAHH